MTPGTLNWQVVLDLILPPPPPFQQPHTGKSRSAPGDRSLPGNDYAARTSWAQILEPHSWRKVRDLGGGLAYWCRPGKDDLSISASTRDDGGLWVFTTNADGFDANDPRIPGRDKGYSKFAAYAVLAGFGEDYTAASDQLLRDGYGTKEEERTKSSTTGGTKEEERKPRMGAAPPAADPAIYTGILGGIVAAAAPTTEADPVGIYASLLAGVGVAMNRTPFIKVGNTVHPLLIWPLLLGRTGSGRKGEANSSADIFLRRAIPDAARFITSGLSSGEGLIERIRDPDEESQSKGLKQPVGTNDKRLLVVETEFYSVLARAKREGSTLATVMRQAWDGQALNVMNRQQLYASSSHVAIIGHISPQEFRIRLAEADMAGGTYNRFFPLFVERSGRLPIPEGVPETVVADLGGKLGLAIARAAKSGQLQFDADARQLWVDELYDEMTAGDDEDLAEAEFTRRAAPYCLRIAGIHAVLDGRREIGKGDLVAAGALVRYSIASARYVLDRRMRDPRIDRIRRAIDGAGAAGLTQTEVSALFSRNLPTAALEQLLAELLKSGEYEESLRHGRGRPARVYRRLVSSSFVP